MLRAVPGLARRAGRARLTPRPMFDTAPAAPPPWLLAAAPAHAHAWPGVCGSPERPSRVEWALAGVARAGVPPPARLNAWPPAPRAALARVHAASYLAWLDASAALPPTKVADVDDEAEFTYATPATRDAAVAAAGAALALVDAVLAPGGRGPRFALSLCRPPGHHAGSGAAGPGDAPAAAPSGFCFLNSAAVAAAAARAAPHALPRVAVVDVDVHVGDGTANIFDEEAGVLVVDTHEAGVWPGGGSVAATGAAGATLNVPLPPGSGDAAAIAAARRVVAPALANFDPGLVIVSLGADAHAADPLAALAWTRAAYRAMGAAVASVGVPVVAVLEGGYSREGVEDGVAGFCEGVLLGGGASDAAPPLTAEEEDAVAAVVKQHGL